MKTRILQLKFTFPQQSNRNTNITTDLYTCKYVFVCEDTVQKPLTLHYQVPFKLVLCRSKRYSQWQCQYWEIKTHSARTHTSNTSSGLMYTININYAYPLDTHTKSGRTVTFIKVMTLTSIIKIDMVNLLQRE